MSHFGCWSRLVEDKENIDPVFATLSHSQRNQFTRYCLVIELYLLPNIIQDTLTYHQWQ